MRLPLPRTLTGQLVAITLLVVLVAQLANLIALISERRLAYVRVEVRGMIADIVDAAAQLPEPSPTRLPYLVRPGAPGQAKISIDRHGRATRLPETSRNTARERELRERLSEAGITASQVMVARHPFRPRPLGGASSPQSRRQRAQETPAAPRGLAQHPPMPPELQELALSIELKPGLWLNAVKPVHSAEAVSLRVAIMTAVIAALASLAIWVFARRITRPLQALAQAADHFGRGEASEPLVVEGPRDIQVSADAFNRMQDRLSRLLETQRTMLRAVGHDLRTPLTSLRIRADSVPEAYGRDQMITVLDDMSVMTEEILRWARDAAGEEAPSTVDLGALVESLTDDYHAQGLAVSFHAPESRIVIRCRRVALRRSLRNVIDNALKYGDCADIRMITHDEAVTIRVEYTGPL